MSNIDITHSYEGWRIEVVDKRGPELEVLFSSSYNHNEDGYGAQGIFGLLKFLGHTVKITEEY
jgi:hypothetical protein